MKNLSDTIKNLSIQHISEIKKILKIQDSSRNVSNKIYADLLSLPGMELVLSTLNQNERNILYAAYMGKNGITFSELEKKLKIDSEKIEKYTNNLSRLLLINVLKNRQKLSNKLDKIYLIPEIRNSLNPITNIGIHNYYNDINDIIESNDIFKYANKISSIKNVLLVTIENIFNAGGIITLEDFLTTIPEKTSQKILSELIQKSYVHLYHDITESGKTIILLEKKLFFACIVDLSKKTKITVNFHNRYHLLLNLLKTYDIISTYGLFLTKQKEFRKIDKKHLDDSMIRLFDLDGMAFSPDEISDMALLLLYLQDCADTIDDSVIISLKNIENILDDPLAWLLSIIKKLKDQSEIEIFLTRTFDLPTYKEILLFIDYINKNPNIYQYLESAYFISVISQLSDIQFRNIKEIKQSILNKFKICLRFLCVSGIIEIDNNIIKLSDIGINIAERLQILKPYTDENQETIRKDTKKIYLNSNFTLVSPKKEIPSDALYNILTHTEIIVDDVILHTRISRESILTSLKRGMNNIKFFATLNKYLKTEIPDNLSFLISEWQTQTIKVKIFNASILYANQPSFIDKIAHSKIKNSIHKRIAPNYAIIDKRYLDILIKMAKENDAVINLFDESEE